MRVAIVLAAGRSRRFVGGNKLLARQGGRPVVASAVRAARAAPVGRVIVVAGHDAARVRQAVRGPRTFVVIARRHRRGVSASLIAGLDALWPAERQIFVFLGDMPHVPLPLTRRMARMLGPGIAAVRSRGRAGPGHPVLLRRPDTAMRGRLSGDHGLGQLITGAVRWIAGGRWQATDIDSRRDLARRRSRRPE